MKLDWTRKADELAAAGHSVEAVRELLAVATALAGQAPGRAAITLNKALALASSWTPADRLRAGVALLCCDRAREALDQLARALADLGVHDRALVDALARDRPEALAVAERLDDGVPPTDALRSLVEPADDDAVGRARRLLWQDVRPGLRGVDDDVDEIFPLRQELLPAARDRLVARMNGDDGASEFERLRAAAALALLGDAAALPVLRLVFAGQRFALTSSCNELAIAALALALLGDATCIAQIRQAPRVNMAGWSADLAVAILTSRR